jgi:hypothetical protein
MALSLFQTDAFRSLMRDHLYNTLAFMLEEGQDFAVAAMVEHMEFTPELPRAITQGFGETALFVLAGYTFESAYIDEEALYFEAGFGEENLGANVRIPFLAIRQIFIGEYPVTINISSPAPYPDPAATSPSHSMEALLSNPENQKLLKDIK